MKRDVFQAIADPTRRAILSLLALSAMTPNAIAVHFDSSRQAISKHIQILNESELISKQQKGREIYYDLNPQKMKEVDTWLIQFRALWESRFSKLEDLLTNQKQQSNEQ